MRIVVMGTGPFAVPMFAAILAAGYTVPALITRPVPPPTGRGKEKRHPNPMREFAESHAIPVFSPETTHNPAVRASLQEMRPDLFVVCDFGEILAAETLEIAPWAVSTCMLRCCRNIVARHRSIGRSSGETRKQAFR